MKYEHWLDDPLNIRRLWCAFLVVLVLSVAAGFIADLHPHFEIEKWPGFNAAFGLLCCLLMIVFAKLIGLILKRPDNYYAKDEGDE